MGKTFHDDLRLELSLTAGGSTFSIPGGQIKHLSVQLASYGFTAAVTFWTLLEKQDAPLFTAFQKPDLIEVRVSIAAEDPELTSPPAPLVLKGLVRGRRLVAEEHGTVQGSNRVFRRYTLDFADAAQVLWRQHRPIELHTHFSMKELLEAHKASLKLALDWTELKRKQPMICLALGADEPGVSFYDYVCWYVDAHQGVFSYDSQKNEYLFADSKPSSGQAAPLGPLRIHRTRVLLPPPIRHGARVLNAVAQGPTTTPIDQPQAVQGTFHDVLVRTPLANRADEREKLEKTRLKLHQRQLQVAFKRYPTVDVFPGALLRLEGSLWPASLTGLGEDMRVAELDFEAHAEGAGPYEQQQDLQAPYAVRMSLRLESTSETAVSLPAYRVPRYPIHVEGLVHSPGGEPEDRRYLIVEDEKTSITDFRMTVPLWNKTVSVPAEPTHVPGQFFFPPYKRTRVLVALHHERAELLRFLAWKEGVRTPQSGQGDQILLGESKSSQTALTHDFQEDKPVWRMLRTSGGDTQVIRMREGNLFIQVKETGASKTPTPTYDVTPQVEAAKGDLSASVGDSLGQTSAAFQGAMSASRAKMQSAQAAMKTAMKAARAEVGAKVAKAKSGMKSASSKLSQGSGQLSAASESAKASLKKLR
ncbi:hypothetical protein CYFUS_004764 [Cystobacter fuscus]|uniref:Uncharacterized protein n=1 Tax=Cystobacter fuscus TaxID=43 RepID=A0A250J711_9BACT|nr:hypothetical protein [Cystobacter fuscus]ATB39320.1 hypothetical protein CYFUS_004764 [Cystobacter fuscus]